MVLSFPNQSRVEVQSLGSQEQEAFCLATLLQLSVASPRRISFRYLIEHIMAIEAHFTCPLV